MFGKGEIIMKRAIKTASAILLALAMTTPAFAAPTDTDTTTDTPIATPTAAPSTSTRFTDINSEEFAWAKSYINDMAGKGFDNQTMAQKAGIPPFAVKRNLTQARGFGAGQLRQALEDGVALEEAVKTGRMNDQMAVELFIIRYSAAKQKK